MIQVIKTKEMKSSTKVEGLLVQMSNNQWYALTRLMPPRHGWYLRCGPSSSTGKMDLVKDVLYMMPYASVKPEFQDGIDLLTNILNGNEEAVITMPNYN
tara:strand:- start:374 stop:670 length:297 start_codon:yes stop_codon:yes gene_type:complete